MFFDIFLKPRKAFEESLEKPSLFIALLIVLISSIIPSTIVFLLTNDIVFSALVFVIFFMNWLVMTIVFWAFGFMFTSKKRSEAESNFFGVCTATGKLWSFWIIIMLLALASTFHQIVAIIAMIIAVLLIIMMVFTHSFVLIKVITNGNNTRTFIAWVLSSIMYYLLVMATSGIILPLFV